MPRRPPSFRQSDVSKALKAATAAGMKPTRVEITPEGRVVLSFDEAPPLAPASAFDEWKAKRDARPA